MKTISAMRLSKIFRDIEYYPVVYLGPCQASIFFLSVMRCAIWYYLYKLKSVKNTHFSGNQLSFFCFVLVDVVISWFSTLFFKFFWTYHSYKNPSLKSKYLEYFTKKRFSKEQSWIDFKSRMEKVSLQIIPCRYYQK